jgi:hypothetical protein
MTSNRRKPEASALRRLFHNQWLHLNQLIDERDSRQRSEREKSAQILNAIETIVEGTDARMRGLGNYKKRLRDGANSLLTHIESLVESLPEPIVVNRQSFTNDPQVNSFFVNPDYLQQVFSRCRELHAFFDAAEHCQLEEAYALLFISRTEKTTLGNSVQGDMIVTDVKQVSVNFSDHQIMCPSETETGLRNSLQTLLFESVVEYIQLRLAQQLKLESQQSFQQKRTGLDKSLKNPEVYLQTLIDHLNEPMELLKRKECILKISKLGILLNESDTETANNDLRLNGLRIGDQARRVIVLVRYPRCEMLPLTYKFEDI